MQEMRYYTCGVKTATWVVPTDIEERKAKLLELEKTLYELNKESIGKAVFSSNSYKSGIISSLSIRENGYSYYNGLTHSYSYGLDLYAHVRVLDKGKIVIKKWVLSALVDLEKYKKALEAEMDRVEGLQDPFKDYYDNP